MSAWRISVSAVERRDRQADRGAGMHRHVLQQEGPPHRRQQDMRQALRRPAVLARFRHDDHELVAREATGHPGTFEVGGHALGDSAQQVVALGVAVGVVDLLELVEIEVQHGHRRLLHGVGGRGQPVERLLQPFAGTDPVGQAGQRVVEGQELGATALGLAQTTQHQRVDQDGRDDRDAVEPQPVVQRARPRRLGSTPGQEHIHRHGRAAQRQHATHPAPVCIERSGRPPGRQRPQQHADETQHDDDLPRHRVVGHERCRQRDQHGQQRVAEHQGRPALAPAQAEQHGRRQREQARAQRPEQREQRHAPRRERRQQIGQQLPVERRLEADAGHQPAPEQDQPAVPGPQQHPRQHQRDPEHDRLAQQQVGLVTRVGRRCPGTDVGRRHGQVLGADQQAHALARGQRQRQHRLDLVDAARGCHDVAPTDMPRQHATTGRVKRHQVERPDAPGPHDDPGLQRRRAAVGHLAREPDHLALPRRIATGHGGGLPAGPCQHLRPVGHRTERLLQDLHRFDQLDRSVRIRSGPGQIDDGLHGAADLAEPGQQ
jgi:hypothetical protein